MLLRDLTAQDKDGSEDLSENLALEGEDLLGSTVENFSNRLARKIKEQSAKETLASKLTQERQARILQAMTSIRRSLQEACKINLGERFSFDMDLCDFEGWPKVSLNLIDSFAPERVDHALIVTATDRSGQGIVQIATQSDEILSRFSMSDPDELIKLPLHLKKTVRLFLDKVEVYVLNPIPIEQLLAVQTKALKTDEEVDSIGEKLTSENLFMEDELNQNENLVSLALDLRPIESLS